MFILYFIVVDLRLNERSQSVMALKGIMFTLIITKIKHNTLHKYSNQYSTTYGKLIPAIYFLSLENSNLCIA